VSPGAEQTHPHTGVRTRDGLRNGGHLTRVLLGFSGGAFGLLVGRVLVGVERAGGCDRRSAVRRRGARRRSVTGSRGEHGCAEQTTGRHGPEDGRDQDCFSFRVHRCHLLGCAFASRRLRQASSLEVGAAYASRRTRAQDAVRLVGRRELPTRRARLLFVSAPKNLSPCRSIASRA
jgi:hypothetical protein